MTPTHPRLRPPLPVEHGAWIGVATACLVGALAGGAPGLSALLAVLAMFALFVAKAPVENLAAGLAVERSRIWLAIDLAAGGGLLVAAGLPGRLEAVVLLGAAAVLIAQAAARRAKRHRGLAWEAGGFFGFGGAATVVALAKGLPPETALPLWPLVGLHLAATVPFVRLSVRPGELRGALARWSLGLALLGPAVALALAAAGLVPAATVLAFAPAIAKVALGIRSGGTRKAKAVGLSETGWTAAFAAILLLALAVG